MNKQKKKNNNKMNPARQALLHIVFKSLGFSEQVMYVLVSHRFCLLLEIPPVSLAIDVK